MNRVDILTQHLRMYERGLSLDGGVMTNGLRVFRETDLDLQR